MVRAKMLAAFAVVGLGLGSSGVAEGSAVRPIRECAELETDLAIPGAPTHVTVAERVDADPGAGTPAYCRVEGFVEPAVRFQLKLPIDTYSGRYLQYGCHGLCGTIFDPAFPTCGVGDDGDLAVAATDDGHEGKAPPGVPPEIAPFVKITDGTWAADDQRRAGRLRLPRSARGVARVQAHHRGVLRHAAGAVLLRRLLHGRPGGTAARPALPARLRRHRRRRARARHRPADGRVLHLAGPDEHRRSTARRSSPSTSCPPCTAPSSPRVTGSTGWSTARSTTRAPAASTRRPCSARPAPTGRPA